MNIIDTIQHLYKDYGQLKGVTIECQKELVAIGIKNQAATAEVFLQGAQITRYQRVNESPTLFLSKACDYKQGSALRGGIPICWPWFGNIEKNPNAIKQQLLGDTQAAVTGSAIKELPAHGFVREREWTVESIRTPADDLTIVELSYHVTDEPLWPFDTLLTCRIAIGATLSVSLHVTNNSPKAFVFSAALHSYFAVSHIDKISISGLDQAEYYDALDVNDNNEWQVKTQQGDITFTEEVDRVYQSFNASVTIKDKNRTTSVTSSGSNRVVVWNPWMDKAQTLSQFKGDDYQRMVCVETANAVDDVIRLEAGEAHKLEVIIV
jgi:glucose-6-phosphate 1-epimerase